MTELVNRAQAPDYKQVNEVRVPSVAQWTMDNGQPLYWINAGEQPVVRLECIFEAGAWYESLSGVSSLAMKMLSEGTTSHTSAQISSYLDRYGAFLEHHSGTDRASLTIYCLTKYLPQVLPLMHSMLTESIMPEKELGDIRNTTLQNLRVNLEKNNYVAGNLIREQLFGKNHPYGHSQKPEILEAIQRDTLYSFYQQRVQNRPFRILLTGQLTETEVLLVNQHLGKAPVTPVTDAGNSPVIDGNKGEPVLIEKEGSLQSSIRLGRRLFTRKHPDYHAMLVFNEILGGYFGSRLMKNIREEKGLTYGIWSHLSTLPREGYLLIGTDVKREFTQLTLDEIWKEIRVLREQPVPADELETVKNYMAGSHVGSLNTPFEIADRYKSILFDGLPADSINTHIEHLRAVTATRVQEMANQYLQDGSLIEVVVGGK